jgi:hypothetical protein
VTALAALWTCSRPMTGARVSPSAAGAVEAWLTSTPHPADPSSAPINTPTPRASLPAASTSNVIMPGPVPLVGPTMRIQGAEGAATVQVQSDVGGVTVSVKVPPDFGTRRDDGVILGVQLMLTAARRLRRGVTRLLRGSVICTGSGRQAGRQAGRQHKGTSVLLQRKTWLLCLCKACLGEGGDAHRTARSIEQRGLPARLCL